MKTVFSLLLVAILSSVSFGQDTKHIVYNIAISGDDPQVEMMKSLMDGANMELYINEKFSRLNFNLGTMMTTNTIVDLGKKEALTLMSGMMGKTATQMSLEELEAKKESAAKPEVELIDETKKIAGYNCKKVILTTEDGTELETWYTDEIEMGDLSGTNLGNKDIPGFPLEFSSKKGPMTMLFTASLFEPKTKVDKKLFDMTIPEGYKIVTTEDLKNMGKE
jgi:GLPGLI family protein